MNPGYSRVEIELKRAAGSRAEHTTVAGAAGPGLLITKLGLLIYSPFACIKPVWLPKLFSEVET